MYQLLNLLQGISLLKYKANSKCWKQERNCIYSVKSCTILIDKIKYQDASSFPTNLLWKDTMPPKIDVFIWLLLHKGVCTKDFLVYRYLLDLEEVLCPFYA
jgi:hypothetical protein